MTKRSVTTWYRLAIAAFMPLVLTVCVTTPVFRLDDAFQDLNIDPPSSTSFAADEPPALRRPSIDAASLPPAVPPGFDAALAGIGAMATAAPHREPQRPPHPAMVAVVPMEETVAPGTPTGVGAHRAPPRPAYEPPGRPVRPAVVAARPAEPGEPSAPARAGADDAPTLDAHEPSPPSPPELLAAAPMAQPAELRQPATAGEVGALRGRAGLVGPTAPSPPAVAAQAPRPVSHPQAPRAAEPTVIQAPTETELNRVRVLIARAEEVGAQFYDPQNLDAAREALAATERIRSTDPGASQIVLKAAEARAVAAFETSVRLAAARLRALLQERLDELREIRADLWVPASFQAMVDAVRQAEDLYRSDRYLEAHRLAQSTADDMLALRNALLDRLELLYGARAETERCLAAAQQLDTSGWSATRVQELQSLYQRLDALYLTGLEAFQFYRVAEAEEAFGAAIEVCRTLMGVIDDVSAEQRERAATLLEAVMQETEAASRLTVVTESGDVIMPQPWTGQSVLDGLRAGAEQRTAIVDGIRQEDASDLHKAQGLWIEGVLAFDDRRYGQSIPLFERARRFLEQYKLHAVLGIHTVQLIPERRESLWRIAEYDRWYGDPLLWPRIWRKNRDLIQNPDLIYPNWKLIIPAL